MKKKIPVLCLLLALILGLAGCGSENSPAAQETKEDAGVTAFIGTEIFEQSLDPVKGAMCNGYPFINNALIKVSPDGGYVGDLAESWSMSEDALSYTVKLKEGIKFSDGSDFTADDVVFTYNEVKANPANNEYVDLTKLEKVEAVDDYNVNFVLKERFSVFLDTLAKLQIVPSDAYNSESFDTCPIGTGPWKMLQYDRNQQMILEPNENCFDGAPKLSRVTLVYMDPDAAFAAAQSGQLDIVMVGAGFAGEDVAGMTLIPCKTMDVRTISLPLRPQQEYTNDEGRELLIGNDVTSDIAVRKALAIGINRRQIIDNALNGVGRPAVNFTDSLVWANTDSYEDNRTDEAKKILEDAGWTDSDSDGVREKEGLRCSFDLYAPAGDNDRYLLAAALSENAAQLGIEINVKSATWDEITQLEFTNSVVWGWGQYSPDLIYSMYDEKLFTKGLYDNVVGFSNPDAEEKIEEAFHADTQQQAVEAWKEVQRIANEQMPYLFLVNIQHCYFVKDNLDLSLSTQIAHPHGHGIPVICNMKDWNWK